MHLHTRLPDLHVHACSVAFLSKFTGRIIGACMICHHDARLVAMDHCHLQSSSCKEWNKKCIQPAGAHHYVAISIS